MNKIECQFSADLLTGNNRYVEGTVELYINKVTGQPDPILRIKNKPGRCIALSNVHYAVKIDDKAYDKKELIEYLQKQEI